MVPKNSNLKLATFFGLRDLCYKTNSAESGWK